MAGRSVLPDALKYRPAKRAVLPDDKKYKGNPPLQYEWGGSFEGWARGYVIRNFWRVREHFGETDDAVQECAAIFVRCCQRYNGPPEQPKLMMAYFKSAVTNDFNTFAVRDGEQRALPVPTPEEQLDFSHGPLAAAIGKGSQELREFLHTVETAPADFLAMLFKDDDLQALGKRIRRLCRIKNPAVDVLAELREILS